MARHVRDARVESRSSRALLKVSGKPYFRAIEPGFHLGYRKGRHGGRWVVRLYSGDGTYLTESLPGVADDATDPDGMAVLSFRDAQRLGRERYLQLNRPDAEPGPNRGPYLISDVIRDYLADYETRGKAYRLTKYAVDRHILPALGPTDTLKLTTAKIKLWHKELAERPGTMKQTPAVVNPNGRADAEVQRARRSTANRILTILKAALNFAWREKRVSSDDAWRSVKPFPGTSASRIRYITVPEARRLIEHCEADFSNLVQAALLTGARYGELSRLEVAEFNAKSGTLHIRTSKSGHARHVVLTKEGVSLFRRLAKGRSANDLLLTHANGADWRRSQQTRPLLEACTKAAITPAVSFHILRHTYASLALMNGAPLIVIARNLGHADTRMVEKHYGHLAPTYIADEIRAAVPNYRFKANINKKTPKHSLAPQQKFVA